MSDYVAGGGKESVENFILPNKEHSDFIFDWSKCCYVPSISTYRVSTYKI